MKYMEKQNEEKEWKDTLKQIRNKISDNSAVLRHF